MILVRVELPMPDKRLSAHNSGDWKRKRLPIRQQRESGYLLARQEIKKLTKAERNRLPMKSSELVFYFFWPDERKRDETNYMQMLKSAVDGCVDAGLLVDDCWRNMNNRGAVSELDRENPRVELVFREKV